MLLAAQFTAIEDRNFEAGSSFALLPAAGWSAAMGRVTPCADSAAIRSPVSLLEKSVADRRSRATRDQLRIAIVT